MRAKVVTVVSGHNGGEYKVDCNGSRPGKGQYGFNGLLCSKLLRQHNVHSENKQFNIELFSVLNLVTYLELFKVRY